MKFNYKQNYIFQEDEYLNIYRIPKKKVSKLHKMIILVLIGLLAMLSSWTFLLGCVLIISAITGFFGAKIFKFSARDRYTSMDDLQSVVTYGISNTRLSFKGKLITSSCKWSNVSHWRILDGWLIISLIAIPDVIFKVQDLKDAEVYEPIMELAKQHGADYDNPNKKV